MKKILLVMFMVLIILSNTQCVTYNWYSSRIDEAYSCLNNPNFASNFNQLLKLCEIKSLCGHLKEYKEYNGPTQHCIEAENKINALIKPYENPQFPGIVIIPEKKVTFQNGCAFTYTAWNTTGTRLIIQVKTDIAIKLNSGETLTGNEILTLYLHNSYFNSGQTLIYNVNSDEVKNVKIMITDLKVISMISTKFNGSQLGV